MTTCTYSFTNAGGKRQVITGKAAFKSFLLEGGLKQMLPAFAARMESVNQPDDGSPFKVAFSIKQTPATEWSPVEEPNGFDGKPGDYITVFRVANMVGLSNANAASLKGLSTYLSMVDDPDTSAGSEGEKSDTIFVYKVQVPKSGFGDYEMRRGGKVAGLVKRTPSGQAGRGQAKYGGFWYSFPQGTNAEQLMTIPLADARAALKAISAPTAKQIEEYKKELAAGKNPFPLNFLGTTSFDYAGTEKGAIALRKSFADAGAPAFSVKQDLDDRLRQKIFSDFDAAVAEYSALPDTKGGKLLDTDQARELSPEYRADRTRAFEVHEAASEFTQAAFEKRMANAPDGALVVFMAGGGGAGKSSAEHLLSDEMERANTILDGTLSSYDKAEKNIQLALDNNQTVRIAYVYREPIDALANRKGGVLDRAMKRGRVVPLGALAKGHAGSSEVVRKLEEKFGSNPNFKISVIDNSRGQGNAVFSTLADVPVVKREGLLEKFKDETDKALAEGWISQTVYDATTATDVPGKTNGSTGQRAGVRPSAGEEVQERGQPSGPRYAVENIGINVNQDGANQYADKIVDGKKTLETRASDSLRPYVGKRVAIVRTGDGPAKAIGAVTIGEPIRVSTQKQFDQYRDQTLVPKDSKFDIAPGGVKYLYPVENPVRYATELDVGLGIVARKVIAPTLSRREQKNPAASRVNNQSAARFERTEALKTAVSDLQEGKITTDEYNRMVDELRPVYPYEAVPALTTKAEATYALATGRGQSEEKAAKYGLPSYQLKAGDYAQLRLDIPSYQNHDAWVVSVHTPKSTNTEVQAAYDAGPVIGYESVAALTDVYFGMNQRAATKIATGTSKATIATVFGKWKPISAAAAKVRADAALKDPAWTQVGMDPFRHSYFYDRDTMRPVLRADEVIQIGPLVLAKNVTFGTDVDNTGAPVAFSAKPPTQGQVYTLKGETRTKAVQRTMQDYFVRMREVQDALIAQGGTIGEAQNVYLAEELSYGRLQEQLQDFKEDTIKPLIKEVKAAGLELSDLALYAYARHAPERNRAISSINKTFGMGEGSGMSTIEAGNIIKAFQAEGKEAALDSLHEKLLAITQSTRLVMLDEGLISQEEFDAWQKQYSDYVPLRGFADDEDLLTGQMVSTPRVNGGRGFNIRGKESVRALGRESRAGHIIENIVSDYERVVARAERNAVAKVFLDLATTNPDPGLWEIDAERTKAAFDRASGKVQYNTLIDKGEDTISAKIAGKEVYIKIKDPLLLRAMRNAGKDDTGALDRALAATIGRYTTLMRNTLTRYNPAFGFVNAVKDVGFGAVSALADLGPQGMALYLKHYANPIQSGAMFEEFRAAGATTGGWHLRDQQELQKELQNLLDWQGGAGVKSSAYALGKATLDALEFIGQYSETQARFAAYKAAREMGRSPAAAGSIAKNLTTNFNRKGEWGSVMNTMYLFFNAGVQGSAKTIKNFKSPYVMAAMTALAGLSAGLAFWGAGVGGDDDDGEAYWDKIPQFEKERNLIIMLPPGEGLLLKGASTVGKNGRYLKFPIQYGLNVFSTFGYQVADLARYVGDHARGASPAKAAVNMTAVVFGAFNPFGGGFNVTKPVEVALAVSPSVVDLGVQALMGVNSFGRPVAPHKYDEELPDSENFGPGMAGTWEQRFARWLSTNTGGDAAVGGAIDVSPGSIRNIVKNLTGGTGDFLTSVFVNIPSKLWSPDGEVGPRDVPVLKAFYGEVDANVDTGLSYERKAEVLSEAKKAANRQKLGIDVNYDKESLGLQSLGEAAKRYTKEMTRLRKEELKIAEEPNLSDTAKNAQRKAVQLERNQLASEFNAEYYSMKKDLAKNKN